MKTEPVKIIFAILAGPILAWGIAAFKIVLVPPNQGFTSLFYAPICLLGFPICVVLAFRKKLLGWKLLAGLALAFIAPILFFFFAAPLWMPGGTSNCQQTVSSPKVRYACADSSSDNPDYRREFFIEGIEGMPLMRIVEK